MGDLWDPETGKPVGWEGAGSEAPDRDDWQEPPIYTASELCEIEAPDADPVLGPLLRAGTRLVIGGRSGDGKTTFLTQGLRCITREEEFLGWRGAGGRCLMLDLEQGISSAQRALRDAQLEDCDDIDYVMIPDGLTIESSERQREWLFNLLSRGYRAVGLDPFYKLHGGDTNDERAMIGVCRLLDRWRYDLHFGLIIPMHLRKASGMKGQETTMDDIFGSGVLTRGAEMVLGLRAIEDNRAKLYFWKDRDGDLGRKKWTLSYSREDGFRRVAEDAAGAGVGEDAVRAAIVGIGDWCDRKAIAAYAELSDTTVSRIIRKMKAEQVVEVRLGAHAREIYRIPLIEDNEVARYEVASRPDEELWTE